MRVKSCVIARSRIYNTLIIKRRFGSFHRTRRKANDSNADTFYNRLVRADEVALSLRSLKLSPISVIGIKRFLDIS